MNESKFIKSNVGGKGIHYNQPLDVRDENT